MMLFLQGALLAIKTELCYIEHLDLVLLSRIYKVAQIFFKHAVESLCLTIRLELIAGGNIQIGA